MAAQFTKNFVQDLTQDIKIRQCGTIVFNADNESNIISVDLYSGSEEYSGGGTVTGACICPDGSTVPLTGSISGKTASVVLTGDCFAFPGQIGIGVQVTSGTVKTTVLKAIYNVELFETDTVVDPGSRITMSVSDLIQDINDALANIPASDTNLKAAMAPVFSTSTAYQAGQYVWYEGQLYQFNSDHAAGTWTGTDAGLAALGDDISVLKTKLEETIDDINHDTNDVLDWVAREYWAIADGTLTTNKPGWGRSATSVDESIVTITAQEPFKMVLLAYNGNTYVGSWMGNGFVTTYDSTFIMRNINMNEFREAYPDYNYKLTVTKTTSGTFTVEDIANHITISRTEAKIASASIHNIFGDVVRPELWVNGTVNSSGVLGSDSNWKSRLATAQALRFLVPVTVKPKAGYKFSVTTYSKDGTFETQFSAWSSVPYTFRDGNKLYRIVIKPDSGTVTPADISNYIESATLYATPFGRELSEIANVKVVNHRGYNVAAPENTIPAFRLSAELGYKYVETDVLFTQGGVPVLMHDDTIDRTCCNASDGSAVTGNIAIESISYNDLITNYDACTPSQWSVWKGTKVPTFEEFIRYCKAYNLHPWIELKWTHTYTLTEVQQIISIIRQNGMEENVSFISFSYGALALVASEWDTVELGLNGSVANAESLKTGKNRVFMIYNSSSDYSDAVNAGFQLCIYTIDTESALASIGTYAYDSILTNGLLPSQVCDVVRNKIESGS